MDYLIQCSQQYNVVDIFIIPIYKWENWGSEGYISFPNLQS